MVCCRSGAGFQSNEAPPPVTAQATAQAQATLAMPVAGGLWLWLWLWRVAMGRANSPNSPNSEFFVESNWKHWPADLDFFLGSDYLEPLLPGTQLGYTGRIANKQGGGPWAVAADAGSVPSG